jgi:hypothetical protein
LFLSVLFWAFLNFFNSFFLSSLFLRLSIPSFSSFVLLPSRLICSYFFSYFLFTVFRQYLSCCLCSMFSISFTFLISLVLPFFGTGR